MKHKLGQLLKSYSCQRTFRTCCTCSTRVILTTVTCHCGLTLWKPCSTTKYSSINPHYSDSYGLCVFSVLQKSLKREETNSDGQLDFEEFVHYLQDYEKDLKLVVKSLNRKNAGLLQTGLGGFLVSCLDMWGKSLTPVCLCFPLLRSRWPKGVHAVSARPRCAYFPTACGEGP